MAGAVVASRKTEMSWMILASVVASPAEVNAPADIVELAKAHDAELEKQSKWEGIEAQGSSHIFEALCTKRRECVNEALKKLKEGQSIAAEIETMSGLNKEVLAVWEARSKEYKDKSDEEIVAEFNKFLKPIVDQSTRSICDHTTRQAVEAFTELSEEKQAELKKEHAAFVEKIEALIKETEERKAMMEKFRAMQAERAKKLADEKSAEESAAAVEEAAVEKAAPEEAAAEEKSE